jgi:probable F420-dependent oxidoreductase
MDLGRTGIALDDPGAAATLEQLGYDTLWIPGGRLDRLDRVTDALAATTTARIATGIISPDVHDADEVGRLYAAAETTAPGRFVVGVGGSQRRPRLRELDTYLDALDAAGIPAGRRILAALGPRKLAAARDRCAGAITLLVTAGHTATARAVLGPGATLVVDQFVVPDTDPDRARTLARGPLSFLATVPGYRTNFARMGFSDDDITGLSDHLVDALVAWGDRDAIESRIAAHRAAGADHVVLSPLSAPDAA